MTSLTFSEKLKQLRKNSEFTQETIGNKLHIQRQTYCNYENASRAMPIELIAALAEFYHVSIDYLICDSIPTDNAVVSVALTPAEATLLDEFASLSDTSKREVLEFIRFKKQSAD